MGAMKPALENVLCNTGLASYETQVTVSILNYHAAYLKGRSHTDFFKKLLFLQIMSQI